MPWIGGRLGWKEPPPAATTTHFASNVLPASVRNRKPGSPVFSSAVTISLRWKVGWKGLICCISASVRPWPVMSGMPGMS